MMLFYSYSMHLLKSPLPYWYLVDVSAVFFALVLLLQFFFVFYLLRYLSRQDKKRHLVRVYSNVISEIILCDTEAELVQVMRQSYVEHICRRWLSGKQGRKVLLDEIVRSHKNISGAGAANLVWLYQYLSFDQDSLAKLASKKWHLKAKAMQELSEMGQKKYLSRIYKLTNSQNRYLRTEAQVAIVRLSGFEGLRFLNIISLPLTQWQQLCLLRELPAAAVYQPSKLSGWLSSNNATVAEFSLRLIQKYGAMEMHDAVARMLQHPSQKVRRQAVETISEMAQESTPCILLEHFGSCGDEEKIAVIKALRKMEAPLSIPFLKGLLKEENRLLQKIGTDLIRNSGEKESVVLDLLDIRRAG